MRAKQKRQAKEYLDFEILLRLVFMVCIISACAVLAFHLSNAEYQKQAEDLFGKIGVFLGSHQLLVERVIVYGLCAIPVVMFMTFFLHMTVFTVLKPFKLDTRGFAWAAIMLFVIGISVGFTFYLLSTDWAVMARNKIVEFVFRWPF